MAASGAASVVPELDVLDLNLPITFMKPVKRINDGTDVSHFLTSLAYRDIGIFVLQLNHSLCPRNQPQKRTIPQLFKVSKSASATPSIAALQGLLTKIENLIKEAPPDPGPRRFGNISFRKWYELLEERIESLLQDDVWVRTLSAGNHSARDEATTYLLGGFGSAQRLDYGTGHELSFVAFLGCLWKLGFFKDGDQQVDIERDIVLKIIEQYLNVIRKLILTYTLEPAGSHGVWGLDDHSFMPYIFGSAQLTRPIDDHESMPLEGSVKGAPRPSDVVNLTLVDDYRSTNMYFSAVGFINDVKKGPFWEHSPILFDISGIKDGWGKINKGMIKMFNAEVLSKFPVVQHFPFGSLFSWETDPSAIVSGTTTHIASQPSTSNSMAPPPAIGTAAPWAQAGRVPQAATASISGRPQGPNPNAVYQSSQSPRSSGGGPGSTSAQTTVTKAPWAAGR